MTAALPALEFTELEAMDAPGDADDYIRGFAVGVIIGSAISTILKAFVDELIVPPVRGDLKLMSIGFFLDENAPVMWRGPMLHRALEQFLSDVHWGGVRLAHVLDRVAKTNLPKKAGASGAITNLNDVKGLDRKSVV